MGLAEQFKDYLECVYPGVTVEGDQLVQVRRAFYAGAWAVLAQQAPDEIAPTIKAMVREALQFNEDVKSGVK